MMHQLVMVNTIALNFNLANDDKDTYRLFINTLIDKYGDASIEDFEFTEHSTVHHWYYRPIQ